MSIPNHPLWADAAHASPNIIPSRGLSPPSSYPYPAYIEVPWVQVSISSSGIVLQGMTGFMSAPVPFNEAMGLQLHDGNNHGITPSSASSRMNPIEVISTAQQSPRPFKLVHQPEQGVSGNAAAVTPRMSGAPAQAGKSANADAMAPQVVRHRIGTPAVISSADRRRVHPRKHRCHICGRMFTSCCQAMFARIAVSSRSSAFAAWPSPQRQISRVTARAAAARFPHPRSD